MKLRAFFLIALLLVPLGVDAAKNEVRTWTDAQGRTIEAKMTGFADGYVLLTLPDGRETKFPFQRLSEKDRGYVRENAPVNPATAARQIDQMVGILREGISRTMDDLRKEGVWNG